MPALRGAERGGRNEFVEVVRPSAPNRGRPGIPPFFQSQTGLLDFRAVGWVDLFKPFDEMWCPKAQRPKAKGPRVQPCTSSHQHRNPSARRERRGSRAGGGAVIELMSLRSLGSLLTRRFLPREICHAQAETSPRIASEAASVSAAAGWPLRSLHTVVSPAPVPTKSQIPTLS